MTTAERTREVFDMSKTRDWLTRDLVSGYGPPPRQGAAVHPLQLCESESPGKARIIEGPGKSTTNPFTTNLSPMEWSWPMVWPRKK